MPNTVEHQRERLLRYCNERWNNEDRPTLVLVLELVTAKLKAFDNRQESSNILAAIRKDDYFIVDRLDRAWCSAYDFHRSLSVLHQRGVTVITVEECVDSSSSAGMAMVQQSAALAELEHNYLSEITRRGIRSCREQGICSGNHTKFGSKTTICSETGRRIVVDDLNELRMAKWVYVMRFEKHFAWDALVKVAEELGFRNRAGKPFSYNKLKDMGTAARKLKALGRLDKVTI